MRAPALVALLALSACTGSRPAPDPPPDTVAFPADPAPAPPASTYEPPAPAPVYEPVAPPTREVDGFRVQVYASDTPAGAEQARAEAEAWWAQERAYSGLSQPMDAYVVFDGGLYKVRMGAFTGRPDAEAALSMARSRFPDAFLVPDRVTVDG